MGITRKTPNIMGKQTKPTTIMVVAVAAAMGGVQDRFGFSVQNFRYLDIFLSCLNN